MQEDMHYGAKATLSLTVAHLLTLSINEQGMETRKEKRLAQIPMQIQCAVLQSSTSALATVLSSTRRLIK